jgi:16S rRNA (guanine527-N7)-methyltransferase
VAPRDFRTRLARRSAKAGIRLADDLAARLMAYYDLLSRWNRKINLTALDDPDEAIDRLLLEPLVAARYLPAPDVRLMDVGSGGGSPAIPLKLSAPGLSLTMVEVKTRKSAFLREAIRQLELDRTTVETSRYEELLTKPELHEAFGVLSLRAVRVEAAALLTLQAFVAPEGQVFLFRGASGPEVPTVVVPPLEWKATYPLIESLQSRLTVLAKRRLGPGGQRPVTTGARNVADGGMFHVEHPTIAGAALTATGSGRMLALPASTSHVDHLRSFNIK